MSNTTKYQSKVEHEMHQQQKTMPQDLQQQATNAYVTSVSNLTTGFWKSNRMDNVRECKVH